jgi:glycerophosphoryl diester phosphodiesterase
MKIIGHRGAAGIAPENTLVSIEAALKVGVDEIEMDLRRTKDGVVILLHDSSTRRVAEARLDTKQLTLAELQDLTRHTSFEITTFETVLKLVGTQKPLVLDIKEDGMAYELVRLLKKYPQVSASLTGKRHNEMRKVTTLLPRIPFYVQEFFKPIEVVHTAHKLGAKGISLNMWLMNPLTYWLTKQHGLELRIYTVNQVWLMRFMKLLYPKVDIYTDRPDRYLRKKASR